jgi:hypothetical protein
VLVLGKSRGRREAGRRLRQAPRAEDLLGDRRRLPEAGRGVLELPLAKKGVGDREMMVPPT